MVWGEPLEESRHSGFGFRVWGLGVGVFEFRSDFLRLSGLRVCGEEITLEGSRRWQPRSRGRARPPGSGFRVSTFRLLGTKIQDCIKAVSSIRAAGLGNRMLRFWVLGFG